MALCLGLLATATSARTAANRDWASGPPRCALSSTAPEPTTLSLLLLGSLSLLAAGAIKRGQPQ